MQDRRCGERACLTMRGLELLENDRASVRGEAGAAEARVDELPPPSKSAFVEWSARYDEEIFRFDACTPPSGSATLG